jgi:AcrR family transcriptional regulator
VTETAAAYTGRRSPLTKDRVLRAAVALADEGGIEALSMRRLGQELGVEAMALYRHVRNKDDLLDGAIEVVVGEIEVVGPARDWQATLRAQTRAARAVMLLHPWAPKVIVERPTVGPALLRYLDSIMRTLAGGGFGIELAHHALHVLGSRVLGFTQDPFDESTGPQPEPEVAAAMARAMAVDYPHLGELAAAASHDGVLGGCDDDVEFAFGVDLILDGLERRRRASR